MTFTEQNLKIETKLGQRTCAKFIEMTVRDHLCVILVDMTTRDLLEIGYTPLEKCLKDVYEIFNKSNQGKTIAFRDSDKNWRRIERRGSYFYGERVHGAHHSCSPIEIPYLMFKTEEIA